MNATHRKIIKLLQAGHWLTPAKYGKMYELYPADKWRARDLVLSFRASTIDEMQRLGILVMRPVHGYNQLVLAETHTREEPKP